MIKECIAPEYPLQPLSWTGGDDIHYCNNTVHLDTPYTCHRYDQSMWNILAHNLYNFNRTKFTTIAFDWIGAPKRVG